MGRFASTTILRLGEAAVKPEKVGRLAQGPEVKEQDLRRVLCEGSVEVAHRHVARHELEARILTDQDVEPYRDEVLELPGNDRGHHP